MERGVDNVSHGRSLSETLYRTQSSQPTHPSSFQAGKARDKLDVGMGHGPAQRMSQDDRLAQVCARAPFSLEEGEDRRGRRVEERRRAGVSGRSLRPGKAMRCGAQREWHMLLTRATGEERASYRGEAGEVGR